MIGRRIPNWLRERVLSWLSAVTYGDMWDEVNCLTKKINKLRDDLGDAVNRISELEADLDHVERTAKIPSRGSDAEDSRPSITTSPSKQTLYGVLASRLWPAGSTGRNRKRGQETRGNHD